MSFFKSFSLGVLSLNLILLQFSCKNYESTGIPVIGYSTEDYAQIFVPQEEYPLRMVAAVNSIEESTLHTVNQDLSEPATEWMLRTITIGIGVSTQIGIGPFRIGAYPRIRLVFTNSRDPHLP